MSRLLSQSSAGRYILINVRHLPKNEYDRLDEFMIFPNNYGITAGIYSAGAVMVIEDINTDNIKAVGFPVLAKLLDDAFNDGLHYVDFFINGKVIPGIKSYNWEE